MNRIAITSLALLTSVAGTAGANCTNNQVTGGALTTLLENKHVCATVGNETWRERHDSGGALVELGTGASGVQPTAAVGSWSVSGSGADTSVTYNYGTGGSYAYKVYSNGGSSYDFCGTQNITATVQAPPCP